MAAVVALMAVIATASSSKKRAISWEQSADMRKADYVYLQALSAINTDSNDQAQRLVDYAASLDAGDVNIRALQALLMLNMNPDSTEVYSSYATLWDEFRADPTQYYNGSALAAIARYLRRYDDVVEIWRILDSIYPDRTETAVNLANAYVVQYVTGDTSAYGKCMDIFNRLERGTGKDLGLSSQKIRAMMLKKDTVAIADELRTLAKANPRDPSVFLYSADIYSALGNDSARYAAVRRACEIDSTNGEALVSMAQYYADKEDSTAYDRFVFRALVSPSLDYETKHQLLRDYVGRMYSDTTQWERIETMFSRMQQINPGEPSLHSLYSAFEYTCGNVAQATEQMGYSLSLDPTDNDVRSSLYTLQLAGGDTTAAIKTAIDGITYSPDNLGFPIMAASINIMRGNSREAIEILNRVKIAEVNNPEAVSNFYATKGDAYQSADSLSKAIETYNKAIEIYPSNFMAYNNAAYAMAQNDTLLDQALSYARYAVLSDMENPTYLDTYAWVYFKKRDYVQAKHYIDLTLKYSVYLMDSSVVDSVADSDSDIDFELAQDTVIADSIVAAIDSLAEDDIDVNDIISAEVLSHAGDIYFMSGYPDEAVKFWQKASALDPKDELLARKVKYKTYFYEDKKYKGDKSERETAKPEKDTGKHKNNSKKQ